MYTCIIVSRIIMQATHPDEFQAVSVRLLGVCATYVPIHTIR